MFRIKIMGIFMLPAQKVETVTKHFELFVFSPVGVGKITAPIQLETSKLDDHPHVCGGTSFCQDSPWKNFEQDAPSLAILTTFDAAAARFLLGSIRPAVHPSLRRAPA